VQTYAVPDPPPAQARFDRLRLRKRRPAIYIPIKQLADDTRVAPDKRVIEAVGGVDVFTPRMAAMPNSTRQSITLVCLPTLSYVVGFFRSGSVASSFGATVSTPPGLPCPRRRSTPPLAAYAGSPSSPGPGVSARVTLTYCRPKRSRRTRLPSRRDRCAAPTRRPGSPTHHDQVQRSEPIDAGELSVVVVSVGGAAVSRNDVPDAIQRLLRGIAPRSNESPGLGMSDDNDRTTCLWCRLTATDGYFKHNRTAIPDRSGLFSRKMHRL